MFQSLFFSRVSMSYVMSISSLYIHLIVSESMQSAVKSGNSPWCVVNIKKAEENNKTNPEKTKKKQQHILVTPV